jgi:hypothetical protein
MQIGSAISIVVAFTNYRQTPEHRYASSNDVRSFNLFACDDLLPRQRPLTGRPQSQRLPASLIARCGADEPASKHHSQLRRTEAQRLLKAQGHRERHHLSSWSGCRLDTPSCWGKDAPDRKRIQRARPEQLSKIGRIAILESSHGLHFDQLEFRGLEHQPSSCQLPRCLHLGDCLILDRGRCGILTLLSGRGGGDTLVVEVVDRCDRSPVALITSTFVSSRI